jgi:hypothetical protein
VSPDPDQIWQVESAFPGEQTMIYRESATREIVSFSMNPQRRVFRVRAVVTDQGQPMNSSLEEVLSFVPKNRFKLRDGPFAVWKHYGGTKAVFFDLCADSDGNLWAVEVDVSARRPELALAYTLAFVREIECVEYPDHLVSLEDPEEEREDGEVQFFSVTMMDSEGETETSAIAVLSAGLTTIAIPVERTKDGVRILPLNAEVPRLFCDFPLLGTESFPFPVIINNPSFNPTEPRDGVFLTKNERSGAQSDENRTIIGEAFGLYLVLLDYASTNGWQDLHLLAAAKPMPAFEWADQKWYATAILKPMQDTLLHTKIVRTTADKIAPIHSSDGQNNIWFPSNIKEGSQRSRY